MQGIGFPTQHWQERPGVLPTCFQRYNSFSVGHIYLMSDASYYKSCKRPDDRQYHQQVAMPLVMPQWLRMPTTLCTGSPDWQRILTFHFQKTQTDLHVYPDEWSGPKQVGPCFEESRGPESIGSGRCPDYLGTPDTWDQRTW